MKFVTGLLAAVLMLADVGTSHAVVRIANDRGGRIGTYVNKYQGLRSSGESVVIDGLCASACTIVLGAVSHDKICVTSRATLGFHAAWDFGANGRTITDREATMMLYSMYPMGVRRWIAGRGGLTPHMIFLRGKVLQAMYKLCFSGLEGLDGGDSRVRTGCPHPVIEPVSTERTPLRPQNGDSPWLRPSRQYSGPDGCAINGSALTRRATAAPRIPQRAP